MRQIIYILVATLLGAACSRTDVAYRNSDKLLEYYSWKTVRTSQAQRDNWRPVLQTTLRHHREHELPLLIAYLDLAVSAVEQKSGSVGAECLVDGAVLIYQRHARLAAELAAPLLAELDADQLRHFTNYLLKRRKKNVARYLDPDLQRREAARQERITERIENWTGKLNDQQRRQVSGSLDSIPDLSESWLAYRQAHNDKLLTLIANHADADTLREYLIDWWVRRDGTSDETRRSWHLARHEFIRLLDDISNTLTDRQRARVIKRLDGFRNDLTPYLPTPPQQADLQLVQACAAPAA